ncbi:TetR/AcrR family transcriptional regulator [Donghicola sp. C2-DW-16]|uniref:TetR/AcrR family transcriptional regulator n=1 Tax=Donghicola mangrovi TaxID=2729614 RepID=A0ABX2PHQ2_9RHOB|nr:TetR/AcrR family transcriptional regulator [Donghicola mangrovi]NVO29010.1 TetR/AcrR family transcriptional regulator [Donghicola mangrovi]
MTEIDQDTLSPASAARRHAAGENPEKRRQILDGAYEVFFEKGFDAASMNGICKAAGVSKGTLYVYFQNKEDLFVGLVEDRLTEFHIGLMAELAAESTVSGRLMTYSRNLIQKMVSPEVIQLHRIVIAMVERMPEMGDRFYKVGAAYFLSQLTEFLRREAQAGTLVVKDFEVAAQQFVDLSMATPWRERLFGRRQTAPDAEEIDLLARRAIGAFLTIYGV